MKKNWTRQTIAGSHAKTQENVSQPRHMGRAGRNETLLKRDSDGEQATYCVFHDPVSLHHYRCDREQINFRFIFTDFIRVEVIRKTLCRERMEGIESRHTNTRMPETQHEERKIDVGAKIGR